MSEEEKQKLDKNQKILEEAYKTLLPWWSDFETEYALSVKTESSIDNYLDGFYLFPIIELTVNSSIDDIPKFINERYQTIISSAYSAGLSIATIIKGESSNIRIYLGFFEGDGNTGNHEYFESIINGVLPGEKIKFEEETTLSSFIAGLPKGGIITGIPSLKNDDEKQQFNISSIIRSMYGRKYVLAIVSKPVNYSEMQNSLVQLLNIRDKCHELTKVTVGEEKGSGKSYSENEQTTSGSSRPEKGSWNLILFSPRASQTETGSKTTGTTTANSEQSSVSHSFEKQNGLAIELEKIADHFIERTMQGFNIGYWETTVTFAVADKTSCDVLGGSFIGELSKPSDKIYPPRFYTGDLDIEKPLFLPKTDSSNPIFPKSLASYLTSTELSQIASPPKESLPGYEIKIMPPLALTDIRNSGEIVLGTISDYGNPVDGSFIVLSKQDLNKHLFVCGLTGSGKTTTVKHILKSLSEKHSIPFLVLESAKRDYRQLLGDITFKKVNLDLFTIGDATINPIRFNPFYVQKGVHPLVHIDYLKAIFNASFSLYGPMPHIIEKCLHNIYMKKGWDLTTGFHPNFINNKNEYDESKYDFPEHFYCFPTLTELKDEVNNYVKNELEYRGELSDNIRTAIVARLESLCVGSKGLMFNTYDFYPLESLLNKSTIFEMENLADDDDKAFFVGLILVLISEYRQKDNPAINPAKGDRGLKHLIVIEEAHRLLKNITTERTSEMMGNPRGKAVEVFCNVISEMRALGQGVVVVEQIPTKISPDVIKNSNTKIVHRLVSKDDQSLLAGSLNISDDDALYLTRLKTGHTLCHKEGMERPVECVIIDDVKSLAIRDDKVFREMSKQAIKPLHSFEVYNLSNQLGIKGKELAVKFLNSLCTIDFNNLNYLVRASKKEFNRLLLMKNLHNRFYDTIFTDFMTKQLLELLSKGIYCKKPKFPERLKTTLLETIESQDKLKFKELLDLLKKYWEVPETKTFIHNTVQNLTWKYLHKKKLNKTIEMIKSDVKTFFFIPDDKLVSLIALNVIDMEEVENG